MWCIIIDIFIIVIISMAVVVIIIIIIVIITTTIIIIIIVTIVIIVVVIIIIMIIIVYITAFFIIAVTLVLECTAGKSLILHWFADNAIIMFTDFVKNDRCIIRSVLIRLDVSNFRIFNNNEIYVKLFIIVIKIERVTFAISEYVTNNQLQ